MNRHTRVRMHTQQYKCRPTYTSMHTHIGTLYRPIPRDSWAESDFDDGHIFN